MYIAGILVSCTDSITIYVAYRTQKLSSDISALLQLLRTLAFSLGCLDFLLVPECSLHGKIIHYVIQYGVEVRVLKIVFIQGTKPCVPRSNMDLTCYIGSTFDDYCANNAVIALPSHTSADKIYTYVDPKLKYVMRLIGFVDSAYSLLRTLARIIISTELHLRSVRVLCCKTPFSLTTLVSEFCLAHVINKNSVSTT
jgi:hypothetical protein